MMNEPNADPIIHPSLGDEAVNHDHSESSPDHRFADLRDIDLASEAFAVAVSQEKKSEATKAILLLPNDNLIEQAERILAFYEAQIPEHVGAEQLQLSMSAHLMRMGSMYFNAIYPPWVKTASPANALSCGEAAQRACRCFERAFHSAHDPLAAVMLAEIYRIAAFYATASHWLEEASGAAGASNGGKILDRIRVASVCLKAEGRLSDSFLSSEDVFPTKDSAGLMLNLQPAHATPLSLPKTDFPDNHSGLGRPSNPDTSDIKRPEIYGGHPKSLRYPFTVKGMVLLVILLAVVSSAVLLVQDLSPQNQHPSFTPTNSAATTIPSTSTSPSRSSDDRVSYGADFDFRSQFLTQSELVGKTPFQLDVMRNEPYARHGYRFLRTDMAQYFMKKPWYHPTQGNQDQVSENFSPLEKRNVDIIRRYEQQHSMVRQEGSSGTVGALPSQSDDQYFVILGSYPKSDQKSCDVKLRAVVARGYSAHIINTNDYRALRHGLLAVVSGPYSESKALAQENQVREFVKSAYLKKATQ